MHTVYVQCTNRAYRILYIELIPLLQRAKLVEPDEDVRLSKIFEDLKTIPSKQLIEYLKSDLKIPIPESARFCGLKTSRYDSYDQYEVAVITRNPELIRCQYTDTGKISNISYFSKERLQIELAKIGYAYTYSRVENARKALRLLSDPSVASDSESDRGSETYPPSSSKFSGKESGFSEDVFCQEFSKRLDALKFRNPSNSSEEDPENIPENIPEMQNQNRNPPPRAHKFGIPAFYGADPEEADNFLFIIENEKVSNEWDDATVKKYFFQSLKSKAFTWYRAEQANLQAKNWDELKESFTKFFRSADSDWSKFAKRKQFPSELGTDYLLEKMRLKTLSGIQVPDVELIQQIIDGLRPDYMESIYLQANDTLDQLKNNVKKLDNLRSKCKPGGEVNAVASAESTAQQFDRLEANLTARMESMLAALRVASADASQLANLKCWRCTGIGHFSKTCPTPKGLLDGRKEHSPPPQNQLRPPTRENSIERNWRGSSNDNYSGPRSRNSSLERSKTGGPKCRNCGSFLHSAPSCPHLFTPSHSENPKNG